MSGESRPLVQLARRAIEAYVREGLDIDPPHPLPPIFQERAGVFVSLKKKGRLRGCIGTFLPQRGNLAEEIIHNAVSAATGDPRFPPVRPEELGELEISVDVLSSPEPVSSLDELDPKRYGVIVSSGYKRGLLLPDLEGVDTVQQQIEIAKQKAWISPDEPVKIERFEVMRYH